MKRWTSQLFPLILLSLLAGLSFWLEQAVQLPEPRRDGKERHDADAVVENFTVRRFTEDGQIKYRLDSPHMVHFGDDESSLMRYPKLVYFRPDAPTMTLTGHNAFTTKGGEVAFFWEQVEARRAATETRPEMVAHTPDLTALTDDGQAFTDSEVEINQGPSWVKGTGLRLDNNTSVMTLQSRVTGLYFSPRKTTP